MTTFFLEYAKGSFRKGLLRIARRQGEHSLSTIQTSLHLSTTSNFLYMVALDDGCKGRIDKKLHETLFVEFVKANLNRINR